MGICLLKNCKSKRGQSLFFTISKIAKMKPTKASEADIYELCSTV